MADSREAFCLAAKKRLLLARELHAESKQEVVQLLLIQEDSHTGNAVKTRAPVITLRFSGCKGLLKEPFRAVRFFVSVVLAQKQDSRAVKSSERPTTNRHILNDGGANSTVIQLMARQ